MMDDYNDHERMHRLRAAPHVPSAPRAGPTVCGEELLVRTRLLPPRLRPQLLVRPQLDALFARGLEHPLTIVKAEAGYGKTTALAAFLTRSDLAHGWYRIGEAEPEPLVYLLHVIHACHAIHPALDIGALSALVCGPGATGHWATAIDALANELLDALPSESILALDDYDLANRPELNAMTARLIEHMPPRLHVIITARTTPNLPGRARWRASGELLELGRAHLAFAPEEIAQILARRTGHALDPHALALLATETEGWPIAVQMVSEGLDGASAQTLDEMVRRLPDHADLLFDYLAEEVLLGQPEDLRTFLTSTALLRRLDPGACDALLDRDDSARTLRHLEERSLFVAHEGTYRYHHLFRDFLLRRAGLPAAQSTRLHARAAAYYARHGEAEEAVYHLLAAGDHAAAAALFATIAQDMANTGRHSVLTAWLDQLPVALVDAHPALLLGQGDAARFASRFGDALRIYTRAEQRYHALGAPEGELRAIRGQALIYLDTVEPARAEPLLWRALRLVPRDASAERRALLELLAESKLNAGRLGSAERLSRALGHARHDGAAAADTQVDPRLYVRDGRFAQARQLVERQLRADPWDLGQGRAPRSHREATVLLAWIAAMTGEIEAARYHASEALELGRALDSPIVECVALSRLGHGWLLGPDRDLSRAGHHYREALVLAERMGVARFGVESLLGLTLIAGVQERASEAEASAEAALAILRDAGDQYLTALVLLALGAALTLCDRPAAANHLRAARELAVTCGDRFAPCAADVWLSIYLRRTGDLSGAHTAAIHALAAAQRHSYDFLLTGSPLLGVYDASARRGVLSAALDDAGVGAYAAHLLRQVDALLSSSGALVPREPPTHAPLYLQTLGTFRVWRAGREIERAAWTREKALHLLQFLVCQRARPIHREQLVDALWPASAPAAAATGLRVALNALRSTLEPGRAAGTTDTFIRRDGETLRLASDAGIEVDSDRFAQRLARARELEAHDASAAIHAYEAALTLYQGDFLAELPYADWATAERETRRLDYLSAAERLASLWLRQGEFARCAHWASAILARDSLWETAYALLMEGHWRQGNRALAVRDYDRCRRRLREALGVDPSPALTTLLEQILRA